MKNGIKVLFKSITLCFCLLFMASFFSACGKGKQNTATYTISGYVFDEYGSAVQGVTISSDIGNATTDEEGKYTFANVEGSLVLSPLKEGYHFAETSKYVKNATDDANFEAFKEYVVSGTALNNNVAVANASIYLSSLAGDFYTMTDENGEFKVSGVAGETEISCKVDGIEFFATSATRVAPNVMIDTTSSLTIKVATNEEAVDLSKLELWVNGSKLLLAENEKVLNNIKCGSKVELKSDYYHFDKPATFVVDTLNQVETFNLNKYYNLSGMVLSGQTGIPSANVFVDGKLATETNLSGGFTLSKLYGERTITAEIDGFTFDSAESDYKSTTITLNGTKEISLNINFDFGAENDVLVSNTSAIKEDNIFTIKSAELGETISVSSNNYHFSNASFVVGSENAYELDAKLIYNATVEGIAGIDAVILLDGEPVEINQLNGIFGNHEISARYLDYIFTSANVTAERSVARLGYKIPYTATVSARSGDIVLQGATVKVNNIAAGVTNAEGEIELSNIFIGDKVSVSLDGYNLTDCVFVGNNIYANLSYNVSGYVKTGNEFVDQAVVTINDKSCTTNSEGYFAINNIYGTNQVVTAKDGFVFASCSVQMASSNIVVSGTYSISGVVQVDEGDSVTNYKIKIISTADASEIEVVLPASGEYQVSGLMGKYIAYAVNQAGANALNPMYYTISSSGVINFSSSGFSVEGTVTTGGKPVAYAKVTAGAISVYTNSEGKYKFELLTSACDITVSKTGYAFSSAIRVEEDATDVNFEATYTVSGFAKFGEYALDDVSVYLTGSDSVLAVTGQDGYFEVSGLSGEVSLSLLKAGYVFEPITKITGYTDSIAASAKIIASVGVVSGSFSITGVNYSVNGLSSGIIEGANKNITLNYGDVISFEKTGYVISEIIVNSNQNSYLATASYTVSASLVSGAEKLSGYEVYLNGKKAENVLVSGNTFTVSGLVGENVLEVKKSGFEFAAQTVTNATEVEFVGTFTISGFAMVGAKPIEGVIITAGGKQTTTASDGSFSLSGLAGKVSISASKQGYTFSAYTNKISNQTITFDARYTLSGVVKSGDLVIAKALVEVISTETDEVLSRLTADDGSFEISGVKGNAKIIVSKAGYDEASIDGFNDYNANIALNMTYKYTVRFTFPVTQVLETVYVTFNGKKYKVDPKQTGEDRNPVFEQSSLQGTNTMSFEIENRKFSQNNMTISAPIVPLTPSDPTYLEIEVYPSYDISGVVVVNIGGNEYALEGIKVTANSDTQITDASGRFTFTNAAGYLSIDNPNVEKANIDINHAGSDYKLEISQFDYAHLIYDMAIDNLDAAKSVEILGKGKVIGDPDIGSSTEQFVHAVYRRDQNGSIIKQNLNYGSAVLGVDPKVSLVAIKTYDSSSNQWVWKSQVVREDAVTGETTANHNYSEFKTTTPDAFKATYGSRPDDYSTYIITKDNTSLVANSFTFDGNTYKFTFRSPMSKQKNYQVQIAAIAPSGTKYTEDENSFTELTIEINKDFWITKISAHDEYRINKITNVAITSNVTYTYYTQSLYNDITPISTDNITASLTISQPIQAASYGTAVGDIVSKTIYGK